MLFTTPRLIIRPLETADLSAFTDMQTNPNVMRYIKKTMNTQESKNELQRFITYYTASEFYYRIWAVEKKEDTSFIGICGIYENEAAEYTIAYRLREKFWGKGYGSEIAKGLFKFGFEHLDLLCLYAYVQTGNIRSISILEKEMQFEKEFYEPLRQCREKKYSLNRANWLKKI